jgi:hypothetical protein
VATSLDVRADGSPSLQAAIDASIEHVALQEIVNATVASYTAAAGMSYLHRAVRRSRHHPSASRSRRASWVRSRRETCDGYQWWEPPGVGTSSALSCSQMSIRRAPAARLVTTRARTSSGHRRGRPSRTPRLRRAANAAHVFALIRWRRNNAASSAVPAVNSTPDIDRYTGHLEAERSKGVPS